METNSSHAQQHSTYSSTNTPTAGPLTWRCCIFVEDSKFQLVKFLWRAAKWREARWQSWALWGCCVISCWFVFCICLALVCEREIVVVVLFFLGRVCFCDCVLWLCFVIVFCDCFVSSLPFVSLIEEKRNKKPIRLRVSIGALKDVWGICWCFFFDLTFKFEFERFVVFVCWFLFVGFFKTPKIRLLIRQLAVWPTTRHKHCPKSVLVATLLLTVLFFRESQTLSLCKTT